jgi:hypothetical protein
MTILFNYTEGSVFVRLLIAHILTDFILQTSKTVADKNARLFRSNSFWLHGILTGVVAGALIWDRFVWLPIVIIVLSHLLIDYLKIIISRRIGRKGAGIQTLLFIIDQSLHIIVLVIAWLMIIHGFHKLRLVLGELLPDYRILLRVLAYLIVVGPVTYLIKYLTLKWADDVTTKDQSLPNAGKWIGILERIIVVTLVFIEQYTAIGFLATTKSILRLIDKPESDESSASDNRWSSRKHTEYVLIGTFLSFGSALLTAIIINRLLKF